MATNTVKALVAGGTLAVAGVIGFVGSEANGDVNLGTVRCASAKIVQANVSRMPDGGSYAAAVGEAYLVGSGEVGKTGQVPCTGPTWAQLEKNCLTEWRKQFCP